MCFKLTVAVVRYRIFPFPVCSPVIPVCARNIPCGDNRIALRHVAVVDRALDEVRAGGAPNPVGVVDVKRVPAEVVVAHLGHAVFVGEGR